MLAQTRGIVLRAVKYSETSLITTVYSEKFGLQTYMIKGVRSLKSAIKPSLLQPLTILDMVVYKRENKNMQHVKELKSAYVYKSIPFDFLKSTIAIFITEVLNKCIREEEADADQFAFIAACLIELDEQQENIANSHIYFLMHYSKFLGFFPQGEYTPLTPYFDLEQGVFYNQPGSVSMDKDISELFDRFKSASFAEASLIKITGRERKILIDNLLKFYGLHIENFKNLRSHKILIELMS